MKMKKMKPGSLEASGSATRMVRVRPVTMRALEDLVQLMYDHEAARSGTAWPVSNDQAVYVAVSHAVAWYKKFGR